MASSPSWKRRRPLTNVVGAAAANCLIEAMEKHDLPLLVHGEATTPGVDVSTARKSSSNTRAGRNSQALSGAAPGIRARHHARGGAVRGSRLPCQRGRHHHRLITCCTTATRCSQGGMRPHYYCLPVLKREEHRQALVRAATGGSPNFFRTRQRTACPAPGTCLRLRGAICVWGDCNSMLKPSMWLVGIAGGRAHAESSKTWPSVLLCVRAAYPKILCSVGRIVPETGS